MNTKELKVEMLRYGDTNHDLAAALKITDATCSKKVNGKSEFTQPQMFDIKLRYDLSASRFTEIFFDQKVS